MGLSSSKQKSSSKTSGTATSTPNVPSYIQGPATSYFNQVGGLLNDTAAPATFGPTANQTAAFNGASGLSGGNSAILDAMNGTRGLMGYTPANVEAGQLRGLDLSSYLNPYTQNVIDASISDLDRARAGVISGNQGAAMRSGAYGGSRHGIVDAETNSGFLRDVGSLVANLRNSGYQNAQTAALADISNRIGVDTGNADRALSGAGFRLQAANQLGAQGVSADNNTRQNLTTQAGLGEMERQLAMENDPVQARMAQLRQIAQLLGINPSDLIGQTMTQSGTSSGTTKQNGGFGFQWGPFSWGTG